MKKRNFTLTEILVSMALIGVLAVIGLGSYRLATESAKRSSTRAVLTQIETALKEIRHQSGSLPHKEGPVRFFSAIKLDYSNGGLTGVTLYNRSLSETELKIFKRLVNAESLKELVNGDKELTDAWGGVIYFVYPGKINRTGFDLIAPGPDGAFGKDAVTNPSESTFPKERTDYYDGDDLICDDLVNF